MPSYPSYCTTCGERLSGENRFCTRCGAVLAPSEDSAEQTSVIPQEPALAVQPVQSSSPISQQSPSRRGRVLIGAGAALALVLLGTGIGLVIERGNDSAGRVVATSDSGAATEGDEESEPEIAVDPDTDTDPEPAFDPNDPLALGYPFDNVDCSNEYVIVLASSAEPADYVSTLAPALSTYDSHDLPASYLRTDESCDAFNAAGPDGSPIYAAYLGPFDDGATACSTRMERTTTGTYVKHLSSGGDGAYYCLCSFSPSDLPDLNNITDAESLGDRRFWMVELQHLMYNAGLNPDQLYGGNFGPRTTEMIRAYQNDRGMPGTGSVDPSTWSSLQAETCSE